MHPFGKLIEAKARKRDGYIPAMQPSIYAGNPEFDGQCKGPLADLVMKLVVIGVVPTLTVYFVQRESVLRNALSAGSGGKISPAAKTTPITFEQADGKWTVRGGSTQYSDDELVDYLLDQMAPIVDPSHKAQAPEESVDETNRMV